MSTIPPLPEPPETLEAAWPAPSYRHSQRGIFREAATVLFDEECDIDTIVLDAPTGLGKSVINTGLCNLAGTAFYTTPQKALRQQLANDEMLADYYEILRARRDYVCQEAGHHFSQEYDCEACPINQIDATLYTPEDVGHPTACYQCGDCTYWNAKEAAMEAHTAVLTFAYLIIDNWLPSHTEVGDEYVPERVPDDRIIQVSFMDRELLVVDEAHTLEGQVASLFAGFTAAETHLPDAAVQAIRMAVPDKLYEAADGAADADDGDTREDAPIELHVATQPVLDGLQRAARHARDHYEERRVSTRPGMRTRDQARVLRSLDTFARNVTEYLGTEFDHSAPWTLDVERDGDDLYTYAFQPVFVDDFLREYVWSRVEKVVLSSATMPAYGHVDRKKAILEWVETIGLNPATTYIVSRDSPFPVANRHVYADNPVGSMSGEGFAEHRPALVDRLRALATDHTGEKGLVHTASYEQAAQLGEDLSDIAVTHYRDDASSEKAMEIWQENDRDILISPALSEGVDLRDELCRWQVAVKVPYAALSNPRVRYRLRVRGDSQWYASETATTLVQAAGRGVRHMEDECPFYVLDADFDRVRRYTPTWFNDAVIR